VETTSYCSHCLSGGLHFLRHAQSNYYLSHLQSPQLVTICPYSSRAINILHLRTPWFFRIGFVLTSEFEQKLASVEISRFLKFTLVAAVRYIETHNASLRFALGLLSHVHPHSTSKFTSLPRPGHNKAYMSNPGGNRRRPWQWIETIEGSDRRYQAP
jgi:hypothetical protein